ncbi:hypothetical protein BCR23_01360 [Enterococcus quebecensis]|uniref:Uncharacterized protein n=1 Tax=Enterococcus quebecensis TaxID=903983 RepID=A0A1E5H491_9ENTE|nr:hypothetical protein BCR23_01360 [Enterococcus quebecensis]
MSQGDGASRRRCSWKSTKIKEILKKESERKLTMKKEPDLEIQSQDGIIPKIQPIDSDTVNINSELWELYIRADDYDDLLIETEKKYKKVVLDVFNKPMLKEDPRLDLLSNNYFKLSQESKFLCFIKKVFELNREKCYIDLGTFGNNQDLIEFLISQEKLFDQIDKYIILKQIEILRKSKEPIYLIDDLNVLNMFFKGFLRESLWSSLYFNTVPLIIKTNYDISIPLIFQSEEDKKVYEKIAHESGLFFL